jgi:hypothetical protein
MAIRISDSSALPHVHHVNVSAQPRVVSEVPAVVIRIFINNDLVSIPEPIIDEAVVVRGNTEIKPADPETVPVPACKPENMLGSEAAGKASVLPGPIEVVVGIIPAGLMSDPGAVSMNVGSFRMSGPIRKSMIFRRARLLSSGGRRAVSRNVSTTNLAANAVTVAFAFPALRKTSDRKY